MNIKEAKDLNARQKRAASLLAARVKQGGSPDAGPLGGVTSRQLADIVLGLWEGDDIIHDRISDELAGRQERITRDFRLEELA